MDRRDVAKNLLAAATGGVLVSRVAEAQTCTPPCYAQTTAESNGGITPTNTAFPPGDPRRAPWYYNFGWMDFGDVPTYVSATTFTIPGNQVARYYNQSRVMVSGAGGATDRNFGRVISSTYSAGVTTIVLAVDLGNLPSDPVSVSVQLLAISQDVNTVNSGGQYGALSNSVINVNEVIGNFFFNLSNGTAAGARIAIGVDDLNDGTGNCSSTVAIVATGANYSGAYQAYGLVGQAISIHTGKPVGIQIGTNDSARLIVSGDAT